MKTAVFVLAVYGTAISLALLKVGGPFRWVMSRLDYALFRNEEGSWLKTLSQCPACLSFWISLILSYWLMPVGTAGATLLEAIVTRVIWSLAMVGFVWIVHVTLSRLGQYDL